MDIQRQAAARPQCGSGEPDDYNTSLQVFGLFLILFLSALSCSFPVAVKRFSWIPVPRLFLFWCRHLGTGVIMATTFVHLIPEAFEKLHDPCLPKFWTEKFPAMPSLIAMLGALVISCVQMIMASWRLGHTHQSEFVELENRTSSPDSGVDTATAQSARNESDVEQQTTAREKGSHDEQLFFQCALLEAGILFHSIFIGMAVAFNSGSSFVVLLVAISFHQMFEGLALGSRIAAIGKCSSRSPKPWLMAIAFGITAPLGQAIGLAVHGIFDLRSQAGLLMVGIANAFSGGLLIYAGLVQLFYEDILSEHSQKTLTGLRRVQACVAFLVGAAGMAATGAWA